ncbi:MAG: ATP-dependent helicase [Candidatus Saccharibacteria bacterium]
MPNTVTKSKILEGLNEPQEKAVSFGPPTGGGPLLIIAGAGTGKTTVLTRRIAWLIEQGLAKPEEILALTFTEKAAGEMAERVDLLMPLGYSEIEISTFHAFCQKILTLHALDIGLPGDFRIITDTRAWMMVRNRLNEFDLDYYRPLGNPSKFIHALLKHFNKAKGEEITPEDYVKYAESLSLKKDQPELKLKARKRKKTEAQEEAAGSEPDDSDSARIAEVANAYHRYQKMLLDRSFLDFGDLINYTLRLFRSRPKILAEYQQRFKYVLIDEFQDTDFAQYELVKMISAKHRNVTVVGDDDQSIYKFRGASISNIIKFKEDYPDAAEVTLVDNYRSAQNILDLSYDFIQQNNPERLESKLKISKKLASHSAEAGTIEVLHAKTVYEEARMVAEKIGELHQQGLSLNEFAILVRANDHADPFISELNRRGITYMFVANRGLYKKPFVLDLLAYLKLLDNYHESENLFRVLNMPKFKIADEDLIALSHAAKRKAISLYEAVSTPGIAPVKPETLEKAQELIRLIANHTQAARSGNVTEVMIKILKETGIIAQLVEDTAKNSENRNVLAQFYRKAQGFENESDDKTVKGFLEHIRLELESGDTGDLSFDPDAGPEAVKIMTIHSSKGLEFGCVFLVNMVEQRFPSRERREQIEVPQALVKEILSEGDVHLMEERRLFYVAATRAKRWLYLTWADDYGGATVKKPSRFLIEAGLEQPLSKSKPLGQVFFQEQKPLPIANLSPKIDVPDSFSFSQISTFLKCPLEYKYKYIFHLPFPGSAPLSFGTTVHETLKKFLVATAQANTAQADLFGGKPKAGIAVPPKEQLYRFYEESWVDDWFPDKMNKEKYRKEGLKILENFYAKFQASPTLPKYLEQPFKLKIGAYKFTGKIDRVDKNPDGTVTIMDYKTGKPREKLEAVDKKQLLIYQWAAEECLGEKVRSLIYWYLQGNDNTLEFIGKPADILDLRDDLARTIDEIVETIRTNGFYEKDLHSRSHDCEFRDLENHLN